MTAEESTAIDRKQVKQSFDDARAKWAEKEAALRAEVERLYAETARWRTEEALARATAIAAMNERDAVAAVLDDLIAESGAMRGVLEAVLGALGRGAYERASRAARAALKGTK